MLSNFYKRRSHNQTRVALANKRWNMCRQKMDWESYLPLFSHGYQKCMFVNLLARYIALQVVFTIECKECINFWRGSPIFLKRVCFWCFLFYPHRTTYQSNIGGLTKKMSHYRPIHLKALDPWNLWGPCNVECLWNRVHFHTIHALEGSLSITTGHCDLAIATHARKMHKKLSIWLSIGVF
jgi:hypothetical protein